MQVYSLRSSKVRTLGIILIVLPFFSLAKSSVTRTGVSTSASSVSVSVWGAAVICQHALLFQRSLTPPNSSFSSHIIRDCRIIGLVFNISLFVPFELLCVPFLNLCRDPATFGCSRTLIAGFWQKKKKKYICVFITNRQARHVN